MINNLSIIVQTLGGLGLFLLGMIVMTEGLRALAGNTIRGALMRFTRSPLSGALTGAASTAILQSSSATTVAAVGFVGAGLMSFPAALGIIFGANIGTTVTGWLVALLGLKLKLGAILLPLIFVGAIMRLFGNGKVAKTGYALAGFGLIFVGISAMQTGMSGMSAIINPDTLPADSFIGRLQLVVLGIIATIITQSSSAGVATALTALYAGAISFEQAAALVIGMDIGTTVTAAVATIGGSVGSRRTGYSHVIYNLFTGTGALLLISPYIFLWDTLAPGRLLEHAEVALVAFHTLFNTLGVIVILPFTSRFAALMEKLVPERLPLYTQKLDKSLLQQPGLALKAIFNSVGDEFMALLKQIDRMLAEKPTDNSDELPVLQQALDDTQDYLDQVHLEEQQGADWQSLLSLIHALDHMQRLHERCEEEAQRAKVASSESILSELHGLLSHTVEDVTAYVRAKDWDAAAQCTDKTAKQIEQLAASMRHSIVATVATGSVDVPASTELLEAVRWLRRVSRHLARITHHYRQAILAAGS